MPKRYVLLQGESRLSKAEAKSVEASLERRYGDLKVIQVEENSSALIVKTDVFTARALRNGGRLAGPGGASLVPVLTSGAIGKLKRRAAEAGANGEIHER